jgi:hypothetical protein
MIKIKNFTHIVGWSATAIIFDCSTQQIYGDNRNFTVKVRKERFKLLFLHKY